MNQGENNPNKLSINSENGTIGYSDENKSSSLFEEHGTFCVVGSQEYGFLEVDLQSIKQKGVENRSISFAIPLNPFTIKVDENENPVKAEMLFKSEKDFEQFKAFISRLNWND
jgi:hypothetical protein